MRSKLFVPCSRPDFFTKALAGDADALSFDLEDAVPPDGKVTARKRLVELLRSDAVRASAKRIIVRINPPGTPFFNDDLSVLGSGRVDLVNIPKVENSREVSLVGDWLEQHALPAHLLINIESSRGLASAARLAASDRRATGLQIGLNDLFAGLGIDRRDPRHVHAALWQMRLAAGEALCFAYDGAWPSIEDLDGFRAEAELSRSLGYLGKSCVHPRQVAIANAVFDRSGDVASAKRLLDAATKAAAEGLGAFSLDGMMIDAPEIEAARDTLCRAGIAA